MNLLTKTILSAVIAISSTSAFAASVSIPSSMQVSEINGIKVTNAQEFKLAQGQNLIKLRYIEDFAFNADDSGALVKSKPLFLNVSAQEGVKYTVTLPELMTQNEARDFINNPVIQLSDDNGLTRTDSLSSQYQLMAAMFKQDTQM
ncbi:DUF2057 domain-containing protein [Shewanella benthica]|nr:DUF2057 family protein [Shewanella sp.]MCL1063433.1 DUF2057 domain-containing protein [Shewanella benthica]